MTIQHTDVPYAAPSIHVVGTLQELTRAGALFPSDDGINLNTAQPIGS